MIQLYGIPNCDTVKRARAWLTSRGVEHHVHDFKREGVPPERLDAWLQAVGWDALLNRKGTTWRQLPEAQRAGVADAAAARALILQAPTLMKRPVVEWAEGHITVGFDEKAWAVR